MGTSIQKQLERLSTTPCKIPALGKRGRWEYIYEEYIDSESDSFNCQYCKRQKREELEKPSATSESTILPVPWEKQPWSKTKFLKFSENSTTGRLFPRFQQKSGVRVKDGVKSRVSKVKKSRLPAYYYYPLIIYKPSSNCTKDDSTIKSEASFNVNDVKDMSSIFKFQYLRDTVVTKLQFKGKLLNLNKVRGL